MQHGPRSHHRAKVKGEGLMGVPKSRPEEETLQEWGSGAQQEPQTQGHRRSLTGEPEETELGLGHFGFGHLDTGG